MKTPNRSRYSPERSKTERTTREDPKPISVYIAEDMKKLLIVMGIMTNHPIAIYSPLLNQY
jgi:hypothetical protein